MDPQTQIDLDAEYRDLIKRTNRQTQTIIAASKEAWEQHRGREMMPGELGRHLGWDTLALPDARAVEGVELRSALEASLVRLIEARRFQNSIRDLRPRPKASPAPRPSASTRHQEVAEPTPLPASKPSVWKRLRRAFYL